MTTSEGEWVVDQITISRSHWARGDGGDNQPMMRKGGMDAIGHYLYRLGVTPELLKQRFSPGHILLAGDTLPNAAQWLVSRTGGTSDAAWQIIATNDVVQLSDHVREERLVNLFSRYGDVDVCFDE